MTILRNEISADKGFTIEPKAPSGSAAKASYLPLAEVDEDQGQLWFAKQPEPEGNLAVAQDSMIMSPAQTADLMGVLDATRARSGLSTRAQCSATEGWNDAQQYAAAIETDRHANTATALCTSHGYFAAPDSPLGGWSEPVWQTEGAPFGQQPWDPAWDDGSPSSGLTWAQSIHTGLTAANVGAFLYVWGANTSTTAMTGPNTGPVAVNGNTVATSGRLWALAATAVVSAPARCASARRRGARASR